MAIHGQCAQLRQVAPSPAVGPGPSTQEKGIILLTKAHLLFMAYHARLAFQNTSVAKDLANLRKEFNKTVRKNFLIKLAKTSEASGRFNAEDLLRMRKGNVPLNYNVHHKLSLDDGGTNDFENLVLIENEPYHKVFTNMQSRIAKGILVGESKITPWAILSGSIYPPMKNIMDHTK